MASAVQTQLTPNYPTPTGADLPLSTPFSNLETGTGRTSNGWLGYYSWSRPTPPITPWPLPEDPKILPVIDWDANRKEFHQDVMADRSPESQAKKIADWVLKKTNRLVIRLMMEVLEERGVWHNPDLDSDARRLRGESKRAWVRSDEWMAFRDSVTAVLVRLAATKDATKVDMVVVDFMWQMYRFTTCENSVEDMQRWVASMEKTFVSKQGPGEPWNPPQRPR